MATLTVQFTCTLLLFLSSLTQISAHAYVHWPQSRNLLFSPHTAHCFNGKGKSTGYKTKHTQSKSGQSVPKPTDFSDGMCGNFGNVPSDTLAGDKMTATETPKDQIQRYTAGTKVPFVIVYNAQHGGQMEFRLCKKLLGPALGSRADAAACFDENLLLRTCVPDCGCNSDRCKETPNNNDPSSPIFVNRGAPKSMLHGADEIMVPLPANFACDECTIQWFWTTAWGEQFWNCIDIGIDRNGGGSWPRPTPVPTLPRPTPAPTPSGSEIGSKSCVFSNTGDVIEMSERDVKKGRKCYDVNIPQGVTQVHYVGKVDIYISWNADACCTHAANDFGSKVGGEANIVTFTSKSGGGSFGFCECTAWDPINPGTSCAGQATAASMVCPVQGGSNGQMCTMIDLPSLPRPESCGGRIGGGEPAPEPEPAGCSDDWGDCIQSRCCKSQNFKCYEKDASYAECRSDGCPGDDWKCTVLPEPKPKPESEALACEYWCDLPPVGWDRKCKWSLCAKCSYCLKPESEPASLLLEQSRQVQHHHQTKLSAHLGSVLSREINSHGDIQEAL